MCFRCNKITTTKKSHKFDISLLVNMSHLISYIFLLMYVLCLQGITYDHVELHFYVNGKPMNRPIMGIKGTVFPIFYGEYITID